MKLKVIEQKHNPFFKRLDVKVEIEHSGEATPSKEALRKELAKHFKVKQESVEIDYIFTGKGIAGSFARVRIVKRGR
jgi:ribosomal protein S24E